MLRKVKIQALIHADAFGSSYAERTLEVEIPNEWATVDKPAVDAMLALLKHYLQNRWSEQYYNCRQGKQQAINKGTLGKSAVEDLKTAIDHNKYYNNPQQLSDNMISVNKRVQTEVAEQQAQWDKDHPIVVDEQPECERAYSCP